MPTLDTIDGDTVTKMKFKIKARDFAVISLIFSKKGVKLLKRLDNAIQSIVEFCLTHEKSENKLVFIKPLLFVLKKLTLQTAIP